MNGLGYLIPLVIFLSFGQSSLSNGWRELTPLQSTRKDVERVLGPADVNGKNRMIMYYLSNEVVTFDFSANPKCREKFSFDTWDVPEDRVTAISVSLKQPVLVSATNIDLKKLKKSNGSGDLVEHFYYSSDNGFSIEVGRSYLMSYIYKPDRRHENLRCPAN